MSAQIGVRHDLLKKEDRWSDNTNIGIAELTFLIYELVMEQFIQLFEQEL